MKKSDIDWNNRVLCSDGNCIGVIGLDGRCKECGLLFEGELPFEKELPTLETAPGDTTPTTDPAHEQSNDGDPANITADEHPGTFNDDEWANRRLCRDGNCIGVIGPDGACKECGLPYDA